MQAFVKVTIIDWLQLQPGNIEVDSIAEKVANGEVWGVEWGD